MSKKKIPKKKNNWGIPENAADYFDPHYDDDFKRKHPFLFVLTVIAIGILVCVAPVAFVWLAGQFQETFNTNIFELIVFIIGLVSSFVVSIGIINLFMILYRQYLGHYVTLYSFAIGLLGSAISLFFIWLI